MIEYNFKVMVTDYFSKLDRWLQFCLVAIILYLLLGFLLTLASILGFWQALLLSIVAIIFWYRKKLNMLISRGLI